MRLWHYKLLPYLPEAQFKGQLRELVAILHRVKKHGTPNHMLVNQVKYYHESELTGYFMLYNEEYKKRYGKPVADIFKQEFLEYSRGVSCWQPFEGWHDNRYLKVCMANLYEKHYFAEGKSQITIYEWSKLLNGYEQITGERYSI